jgi:hypothetical protein
MKRGRESQKAIRSRERERERERANALDLLGLLHTGRNVEKKREKETLRP